MPASLWRRVAVKSREGLSPGSKWDQAQGRRWQHPLTGLCPGGLCRGQCLTLDSPGSAGESHSVLSDSLRPHELACQAPLSMEFSRPEYRSG